MNRKIKVFLLLFILIFALLSVSSVCFAAKETRIYGRPGLNTTGASNVESKTINNVPLFIVTNGGIKVGLRESKSNNTNKLLVFFPGQGQYDSIVDEFPFKGQIYDCDIAVVQAPSQPKNNPNYLLFDTRYTNGIDNIKRVKTILSNYLNNTNYDILVCGYSLGGKGAINLTKEFIGKSKYKNRIELVIIDGITMEMADNYIADGIKLIKDMLDSKQVKVLVIIASGHTFDIATRTSRFLNAFNEKKYNKYNSSPKFMQIKLNNDSKYNTHDNVVKYLYDNVSRIFFNG